MPLPGPGSEPSAEIKAQVSDLLSIGPGVAGAILLWAACPGPLRLGFPPGPPCHCCFRLSLPCALLGCRRVAQVDTLIEEIEQQPVSRPLEDKRIFGDWRVTYVSTKRAPRQEGQREHRPQPSLPSHIFLAQGPAVSRPWVKPCLSNVL